MKNGIAIALMSCGLIACGGESSDSPAPGFLSAEIEFAQDFRGLQAMPDLTTTDVTEGDSIAINSEVSGNILEGSSINLTFTAEQSGLLTVFTKSAVESINFTLTNTNDSVESSSLDHTNPSADNNYHDFIVFEATEGSIYNLEIESLEEAADFQLVLTVANRETHPINENENLYLVSETYTENRSCVSLNERGQIEESNSSDTYHNFSLMNWEYGHHSKDLLNRYITIFTSVKDNVFYHVTENIQALTYTTNFETGEVSSHGYYSTNYSDADNRANNSCTISHNMTGKIVL